jgi:hypothetical protein
MFSISVYFLIITYLGKKYQILWLHSGISQLLGAIRLHPFIRYFGCSSN